MQEYRTGDKEKRPEFEVRYMNVSVEAATKLRNLAEPRQVGDSVKAAITRVAKLVGLAPGRVEDIWRQEARAIRAEEMDAIRAAARARQDEEDLREELRINARMLARIEALEAALLSGNTNVDRQVASQEVQQTHRQDRALEQGRTVTGDARTEDGQ